MLNFNERCLLLDLRIDAVEHAYYRAFTEIIFTIDSFRGKKKKKTRHEKNIKRYKVKESERYEYETWNLLIPRHM